MAKSGVAKPGKLGKSSSVKIKGIASPFKNAIYKGGR